MQWLPSWQLSASAWPLFLSFCCCISAGEHWSAPNATVIYHQKVRLDAHLLSRVNLTGDPHPTREQHTVREPCGWVYRMSSSAVSRYFHEL